MSTCVKPVGCALAAEGRSRDSSPQSAVSALQALAPWSSERKGVQCRAWSHPRDVSIGSATETHSGGDCDTLLPEMPESTTNAVTTAPDLGRPLGRFETWVRLIVGFALVIVMACFAIVFAFLLLPWRLKRIQVGNLFGKTVGPVLVWLACTRPVFKDGLLPAGRGPAVYVSNHVSILDLMFGMWLTPLGGCGTAKREIAKIPFFGWLYRLSGHLLLDRGDRTRAIATLDEAARFVQKHGISIWIWPEGTRSRDGRLSTFKKGFVHLAIATGLPVVPVVVHNAHHRWPADTFAIYPGDLHIEVLDRIDTAAWQPETAGDHAQQVHAAFAAALSFEQQPLAGKADQRRLNSPREVASRD